MTKDEEYRIFLATDEELLNKHYYRRVWLAARNARLTRRDWLDQIADALRDFDGTIWAPNGELYEVPLVDDVFNDDGDMRWMSDYLRPGPSGTNPYRMTSKLERVRMIDLYFKIRHPIIARHFKR